MTTVTTLLLIIACICFFLAFVKGWTTINGADRFDLVSLGLLFLTLSFLIH
jgi:hypothetical protein